MTPLEIYEKTQANFRRHLLRPSSWSRLLLKGEESPWRPPNRTKGFVTWWGPEPHPEKTEIHVYRTAK